MLSRLGSRVSVAQIETADDTILYYSSRVVSNFDWIKRLFVFSPIHVIVWNRCAEVRPLPLVLSMAKYHGPTSLRHVGKRWGGEICRCWPVTLRIRPRQQILPSHKTQERKRFPRKMLYIKELKGYLIGLIN